MINYTINRSGYLRHGLLGHLHLNAKVRASSDEAAAKAAAANVRDLCVAWLMGISPTSGCD
jgi:hypothetical protein